MWTDDSMSRRYPIEKVFWWAMTIAALILITVGFLTQN
jgi:hypothetical protein